MASNARFDDSSGNDIPLLDWTPVLDQPPIPQWQIKRKPLPTASVVSQYPPQLTNNYHAAQVANTSYVQLNDHDDETSFHETDSEVIERNDGDREWSPHTLRWQYLVGLATLSLVILIAIVNIHWYSQKNHGLGDDDDDSSILLFGWKFVPTLVAVAYTLLFTMMLEDIKRTEPYARLADAKGGRGKYTVLAVPGAWWNALFDGFSTKKNNGSRSWTMASSATGLVLALLIISPLSSTFLVSEDVSLVSERVPFRQMSINRQSALNFSDGGQVVPRFRAIGHMLQNITTSAWIDDDFFVLPVWPQDMTSVPTGSFLSPSTQSWRVESTVFKCELNCQPLHLMANRWDNVTSEETSYHYPTSGTMGTVILASDSGCSFGLALTNMSTFAANGGVSWANQGNFSGGFNFNTKEYTVNRPSSVNSSQECAGDETLIMSTPWYSNYSYEAVMLDTAQLAWSSALDIRGQVCSASYYAARIPVQINTTAEASSINFSDDDFRAVRQVVDNNFIVTEHFQDLFLSTAWDYHLKPVTDRPPTGGPAGLLMATYNFSLAAIFDDKDFVARATRIKQRYFGEAMLSSLLALPDQSGAPLDGDVIVIRTRILAVPVIAIVLEILFSLEIFLVLSLLWLIRTRSRSLKIGSDPAKSATIAMVTSKNDDFRHKFQSYSAAISDTIEKENYDTSFRLESINTLTMRSANASLNEAERMKSQEAQPAHLSSWRPSIIKRWAIASLLLLLALILIAIAILYGFSEGPGLDEKAFIYETQISISALLTSTIAPYSIVPTVLAIAVGLWWGAMETEFRLIQPFVAMARAPTTMSSGINLSYQSSSLLWAAVRAGHHRHWLLTLICTGAFLSQIFTISMSALWQPDHENRLSSTTLQRSLEARAIPFLDTIEVDPTGNFPKAGRGTILSNLYGQLQTNWLYSATIQLSLNGTQPRWSQDGWSFIPVDMSGFSKLDAKPSQDDNADILTFNLNVTFATPAVRARLECSPVEILSNISNWLYPQDFRNDSVWNVTVNPPSLTSGYSLGPEDDSVYMRLTQGECCEQQTSFHTTPLQLQCCENKTDGDSGPAVIAYWSSNTAVPLEKPCYSTCAPFVTPPGPENFTVKWMHGTPMLAHRVSDYNYPTDRHVVFPQIPRIAALNCRPLIQKANANVTVDYSSGSVLAFNILDDLQTDEDAWSDNFVWHNQTAIMSQVYNFTTSYGHMFLQALLRAADIDSLRGTDYTAGEARNFEGLDDLNFNVKQPGMNMDYMSYAMYSQVGQNPETLLDTETLFRYANHTFSTFFQHFVSANTTAKDGGWAYQAIGASLPADLLPPVAAGLLQPTLDPISYTDRNVVAQASQRLRVLHMAPLAAWLCMSILLWLIVTGGLILIVERRYLSNLIRGVKTIADVTVLVAGSDALLNRVRRGLNDDDQTENELKTRLGWFRDRRGIERWGIELVGHEHEVEWLNDDGHDLKSGRDTGGESTDLSQQNLSTTSEFEFANEII